MRIVTFSFLAFFVLFLPVSNAGDRFLHLTPDGSVLSDYQCGLPSLGS